MFNRWTLAFVEPQKLFVRGLFAVCHESPQHRAELSRPQQIVMIGESAPIISGLNTTTWSELAAGGLEVVGVFTPLHLEIDIKVFGCCNS